MEMGREAMLLKPFVAVAAVLVCAQAALAQPVPITQRHAYEGQRRPTAQLATVFGKILTMPLASPLAMTMIQKVDGKSVRGMFEALCCDVVYVLPGSHQIFVAHSIPGLLGRNGAGTLTGNLAAGRVYEAEAIVSADKIAFRLREMPPGYVLTYKDLRPASYQPTGSRQNSRVVPTTD
jgi:hypothetical protein